MGSLESNDVTDDFLDPIDAFLCIYPSAELQLRVLTGLALLLTILILG